MKCFEIYKLFSHAGKVIAMGTLAQMFSYVKHYVPDGRYQIAGPDLKLHCLRRKGFIQTDPDAVSPESSTTPIRIVDLMEAAAAEEKEDGDEG